MALLHLCQIYDQATVDVRHKMIEWNEACVVCTDHRHTKANCAWNTLKPCNIRGCYQRYHTLLHRTVTRIFNVIKVIDLTMTNSLLPVMIYTFKDQKRTTTILFDSGSTVSLIEKDFATSLGLKGFPITTLLYKACESEPSSSQALHLDI